ncbi:MAG: hypothetical protein J6J36_00430 [Clostridia bacterium]|nr:hypothetical protein [Clostridia bacterium]
MKYKYSNLEKEIQELKESDRIDKFYLYSKAIADITKDDETATNLARKVLKNDVINMLEKIQALFQRSSVDCKNIENMSEIEQLISWLEYINPDEF